MADIIYAYLSLDRDYYIGNIYVEKRNGRENISFEYSDEFLTSPYALISLDPELEFYALGNSILIC